MLRGKTPIFAARNDDDSQLIKAGALQLRICSAHFEGGEKKEGDIPVPDPEVRLSDPSWD